MSFHVCYVSLLQASHPLLEQSYYLDEYHKARLKKEFGKYHILISSIFLYPITVLYILSIMPLILFLQTLNHGVLINVLGKQSSSLLDVHTKIERIRYFFRTLHLLALFYNPQS